MKYCIPENRNSKYMAEIDEIIVKYNNKNPNFINYLVTEDRYKDKRIILKIDDETIDDIQDNELYKIFGAIKTVHPHFNFALRFDTFFRNGYDKLYDGLKEFKIPFFFSTIARDFDTFFGFADFGVSDIYIAESLCFNMKAVGAAATERSISIRTFANVCQTSWFSTPSLKTFFIRPEDVDIYANYIDVLEFYGNSNIQDVMYKVYAKDKKWIGDLKDLIVGFNEDVNNRNVLPTFAEKRLNCDKKCQKGNKCKWCECIQDLSSTLHKKKLIFK